MKAPWRVFHEELKRQLDRHDVDAGAGGGIRRVPEADVPRMSTAVANAVLDHLTGARGLDQDRALEVTQRFFAELGRRSERPLEERLERVWREWEEP